MKPKKLIVIVLTLTVCLTFLAVSYELIRKSESKKDGTDAANLRKVIAEAYINTQKDPDFFNTATKDQPMEIPQKYYTYVESVQGDGPVHVTIDVEGEYHAYFGEPHRSIGYYADLCG